MDKSSPDYKTLKTLFLEEQRRREEADQRREEEQRRREEEQRRREEEQRRREEEQRRREEAERDRDAAETRIRKTNLPELLDACHIYLHLGLNVQNNSNLSTKGDPANADSKPRPDYIRQWKDFGEQQKAIWKDLMHSKFIQKRQFTSTNTLRENGETINQRLLSSELDLHVFQRDAVENHVSAVITQLHEDRTLRKKFSLKGSVKFENHSNTLSPENAVQQGIEQIDISGARRRSPRLRALQKPSPGNPASAALGAAANTRSPRSRADQFCVYNISTDSQEDNYRIPIFIVEYKAPHKLTLGLIYEGLENIEDVDVGMLVQNHEVDDRKKSSQLLIAAVITQTFSYMVNAGLEYGCVCTGEAYIFLQIPEDARTVHYFLSVPKGDVGPYTGWNSALDQNNRLHLTAVGQMIAFTLLATRKEPRSRGWRTAAVAKLKTWKIVPEEIMDEMPSPTRPSSEYRPPISNTEFFRASPIQLRTRRRSSKSSCRATEVLNSSSDESGPESPLHRTQQSSAVRSTAQSTDIASNSDYSSSPRNSEFHFKEYRYCTQECLKGLVDGGILDKNCPNVNAHGSHIHKINRLTFLRLIRKQIGEDPDYNIDCLRIHGARGVMFCVRLTLYGYTVVAKGTTSELTPYLLHEADIYKSLQSIQGEHVPVYMGNINLVDQYFYDGNIMLSHMMFLSYGGIPLPKHISSENKTLVKEKVAQAIAAVHDLYILHNDAMPRNLLWNLQTQTIMIIDFERARSQTPRTTLGEISPNRQRKRECSDKITRGTGKSPLLSREARTSLMEIDNLP